MVLPPVVAARVEAVQPGRGDGVVVADAINIRAIVPRIARQRNRQSGSTDAGTKVLLPRAAEEERDLLLGGDHLARLDAVLVVRKLGSAEGNGIVADVCRGARDKPRNVRLCEGLHVAGNGFRHRIE